MADPVMASDGFTYERESIELWMKSHDTSPTTSEPLEHKVLTPNHVVRKLIVSWCEQNGVPVPVAPKPKKKKKNKLSAAGGGAAAAPMPQKPMVTCQRHTMEPLRVFCLDCNCAVCMFCAVDFDICKSHNTKALEPLFAELKADTEGWARAQKECDEGAEQLCAAIQADGDTKVRVFAEAISAQVLQLQQQVRSATEARSTAIGAILHKRQERQQSVDVAAACPEVAVKASATAAVIFSALHRAQGPIAPALAAQFLSESAPAAIVGRVVVTDAVTDHEDEVVRAAASEAAAVGVLGALNSSSLLQLVRDRRKVRDFAAHLSTRLAGKSYRLLYKWSASFSIDTFYQQCSVSVRVCLVS
jgi:hypothetical protein